MWMFSLQNTSDYITPDVAYNGSVQIDGTAVQLPPVFAPREHGRLLVGAHAPELRTARELHPFELQRHGRRGLHPTPGRIDGRRNLTDNMGATTCGPCWAATSPKTSISPSRGTAPTTWPGTRSRPRATTSISTTRPREISKVVFGKGFTFTASAAHAQYKGITNDYDDSYLLCNASIGKKLFRNRRGEISIGVNDLFNQNTAFVRTTRSGWTQNARNSVIGRYYMVTFTYNLRRFGKNATTNPRRIRRHVRKAARSAAWAPADLLRADSMAALLIRDMRTGCGAGAPYYYGFVLRPVPFRYRKCPLYRRPPAAPPRPGGGRYLQLMQLHPEQHGPAVPHLPGTVTAHPTHMPPAPRPASRIRQTHDAAPQEPRGPAHPHPATLRSPYCTQHLALHRRTMRRRKSRAAHLRTQTAAKRDRKNLTHQMRIASNHRPANKPPPLQKHRCRKIRHRCVRVFKSSFRVFRAAPGPQSKPSRKQRSPKARRTTSRKTMPPALKRL